MNAGVTKPQGGQSKRMAGARLSLERKTISKWCLKCEHVVEGTATVEAWLCE